MITNVNDPIAPAPTAHHRFLRCVWLHGSSLAEEIKSQSKLVVTAFPS